MSRKFLLALSFCALALASCRGGGGPYTFTQDGVEQALPGFDSSGPALSPAEVTDPLEPATTDPVADTPRVRLTPRFQSVVPAPDAHLPVIMLLEPRDNGMGRQGIELTQTAPRVEVDHKPLELAAVASFPDVRMAGIAVSRAGRKFIAVPRWSADVPASVAELLPNGRLRPYPNELINKWNPQLDPREHLICVQSVYVDSDDFLWIVDSGSPQKVAVIPEGPKLLRVDLTSNTVVQTIRFDRALLTTRSFLSGIQIDVERRTAYISDSGIGSILVVDLESGSCRRVLYDDVSTKAEQDLLIVQGREMRLIDGSILQVHVNGLALDAKGDYLYYHALTAEPLYRIHTRYLRDPQVLASELSKRVERLERTGPVDGMLMDKRGNLFMTDLRNNAILIRRADGNYQTLVQDGNLSWPDSLSLSQDNELYVTASQLQSMPQFNRGQKLKTEPFGIFKISLNVDLASLPSVESPPRAMGPRYEPSIFEEAH